MTNHSLTKAEVGLTKKCTGECGRRLTLDHFYVHETDRITVDGRKVRKSECIACYSAKPRETKRRSDWTRAKQRARGKARVRLSKACPELFNILYQEELQKEMKWLSNS